MNYKIETLNKETVLFMSGFEKDIKNEIRELLNLSEYKNLQVDFALSLRESRNNKRTTDTICVNSNASFAISYSNQLLQKINEYLRIRQQEIDAFLNSSQYLELNINFKEVNTDNAKHEQIAFIPTNARYSFKQVILSDEIIQQIFEALNIIKYQDVIYNKWGFEAIDPIPKSVLNFYGPPGTGKTMCAHAIANELGKKILALNYAEIESKYVGEAPKNLMKAFTCAKENDCILFFDEADSFLGKRIQNVTQGADQALNSLRSQMLILLEEFPGVVIFATNLVSNFDKAFESRILKHIRFELPNEEARVQIISKMIPSKLPLDKPLDNEVYVNLSKISEGFSGREIKSAILECMLAKVTIMGENAVFYADDFSESFHKRQDSLKKLKEDTGKEKKEKILKAIQKSGDKIAEEINKNTDNGTQVK